MRSSEDKPDSLCDPDNAEYDAELCSRSMILKSELKCVPAPGFSEGWEEEGLL